MFMLQSEHGVSLSLEDVNKWLFIKIPKNDLSIGEKATGNNLTVCLNLNRPAKGPPAATSGDTSTVTSLASPIMWSPYLKVIGSFLPDFSDLID